MLKKCIKCSEEKDIDSCFPKKQPYTSPYIGMCYDCIKIENTHKKNIKRKEARDANIEAYRKAEAANKDSHPEYRERNRISEKKRYHKNKDIIAAKAKLRYIKNKDKISEYKRQYRADNKEALKAKKHDYYMSVKDTSEYKQKKQEYIVKNREGASIRHKNRYHSDIEYKIAISLRNRLNKVIKCGNKTAHTIELLGCSYEYFIQYIQRLYTEGMSDELLMNGSIHIDHIRPCNSFVLSNEAEQYICTNYRNLRPMWAADNLAKNNRWDEVDQKSWYADIWPHIKQDLLSRKIIDPSYEGC